MTKARFLTQGHKAAKTQGKTINAGWRLSAMILFFRE
jgi:hypothetical protein